MKLYINRTPFVSIILPTYNRSKLIGNAIQSVINQTYKNWELLIVDDGSSDNTFDVCKPYLIEFENIRYLYHKNKKLPLTLNEGILAASGSFITFLGSDDCYKPEHLELRVEILNSNNKIDFIHGGVEIIGNPYVKDKNNLSKLIHLNECKIGGSFFIRKSILLKLGGFLNISYSEDSDLFERAEEESKIIKVDFPTYIYNRDTEDSICNQI